MSEQEFNVAVRWASEVGKVFKMLGIEKTLEIAELQGKDAGEGFVVELKKLDEINTEVLGKMMEFAYQPMGMKNLEAKATPTSMVVTNGDCPLYEGFKMAGLDDETIDKICRVREKAVFDTIAKVYPGTVSITRNKPDGPCVVVYKVK